MAKITIKVDGKEEKTIDKKARDSYLTEVKKDFPKIVYKNKKKYSRKNSKVEEKDYL